MSQFFIDSEDKAARCRESMQEKMPITVIALSLEGRVEPFIGIVQSVDEDAKRHPSL